MQTAVTAQPIETWTLPRDRPFYEEFGFSGVVRHGDTLYLSGVVAGLRSGETEPSASFERAFASIGEVLAMAGADWGDVVEMTTYHTDLDSQLDPFRAVKDRYTRAPWPAWTAVEVTRLVPHNGLVEIKIVARVHPVGAERPSPQ